MSLYQLADHEPLMQSELNEENTLTAEPKTYSNRTSIRSIGEVKTYLEHFLPSLSPVDIVSNYIFNPLSILINVCFIIYNFISMQRGKIDYQTESINYIHNVITWLEVVGLFILFITAIIALCANAKTTFVHCVALCGSWSSFKLFYAFRPQAMLSYGVVMYTHHPDRGKALSTKKIEKWGKIKHDIQQIIETHEEQKDYNSHIYSVDELKSILQVCESQINKKTEDELEEDGYFNGKIINRLFATLVVIIIGIVGFLSGMLCFVYKLSQFSFVHDSEVLQWSLSECFLIMGFANQLWNM
eukprot:463280_1